MIVMPEVGSESVPAWFGKTEKLVILAIMVMPTGGPKFLIWSSKQLAVGLFPTYGFRVVDSHIPSHWTVKTNADGYLELSPIAWQAEGFWDRYNDDDPAAVKIFEQGMQAVIADASGTGESTGAA